jgi:tetratricopeptide (TPR) repeat protein
MISLLLKYVETPHDPSLNFMMAYEYEQKGQIASAATHYLKAADNFTSPTMIYEALLRTAICFKKAGGRYDTVIPLLKRCVALAPHLPEAYFHLAQYYEWQKNWHDCYMISSIGIERTEKGNTLLEYPGKYGLEFFKAVAAWWIGNTEESRELMHALWMKLDSLSPEYKVYVLNNIHNIGHPESWTKYTKDQYDALKRKFPAADTIERNYSQAYQDMFALMANKGKKGGYFLEIGCADPFKNNNTYLLEKDFNWRGISIDIDFAVIQKFRQERPGPSYNSDALKINYLQLLKENNAPKTIDYLQIDCDPPTVSLEILKRIPFNEYKFNAITFEHDFYADPTIREQSRAYLRSHNYELVVSDVAFTVGKSFEDWWVHSSVHMASPNKDTSNTIKVARDYMFDTTALKNSS